MNSRLSALITGWSLILMAIIAGFSIGYAFEEFKTVIPDSSVMENIFANQGLYLNMLIGIFIILLLDLLISYTLYIFFKEDNKKIALLSATLRVIYTLLFALATVYLVNNLNANSLNDEIITTNFQSFESTWYVGLILFGFHIILIAFLMKLHVGIPKALYYLTLIAGVAYVVVHSLKLISPESPFVTTIEMVLVLPMALGELGLAVWLIAKGGKKII